MIRISIPKDWKSRTTRAATNLKQLNVEAVCFWCGHQYRGGEYNREAESAQIPETENPTNCPSKKCRSTLWNKGGVDGRTREARIKTGRSGRTRASQ